MNKDKWIETKKEFEVNEVGNLIPKKITTELQKHNSWWQNNKDAIDTLLKVVGLISIGLPILLFYFQQDAERKKQKALLQVDVYSNASTHLHKLLNKEITKAEFEDSKNKVFYEYYPKIVLLSEDSIVKQLDRINYNLSLFTVFSNFATRLDSLKQEAGTELIFPLYDSRLGDGLDIYVDTIKLNNLRAISMKLSEEINNYETKLLLENIRAKPLADTIKKITKSKSDGYYKKISYAFKNAESIQSDILTKLLILSEEVQRNKKHIKSIGKDSVNTELENSRNKITENHEWSNSINALLYLIDDYHDYILQQTEKLDSQFIKSNRFLFAK